MNLPSWVPAEALFVAVGLLIVGLAFVWWWVPKRHANRLRLKIRDPKARADIEDNYRKTLSQLFGGVTVLLGAAFAYYQSQLTTKASSDLLISQQISKGFELLGNENIVIRLGGIYALEGVMNNSQQYREPVIETLTAFIRHKTVDAQHKIIDTKYLDPDHSVDRTPVTTDIQAALTVIGRRLRWPGEEFIDLQRTRLYEANLFKADLNHAYLSGANLGRAYLFKANLSHADLRRADLTGADLTGAKLIGAKLIRANLVDANLSRASLSDVDFSGAFLAAANLSNAYLFGADLSGAKLEEVRCDKDTKLPPGVTLPCSASLPNQPPPPRPP